ncbi:hypothetical protein A2774_02440 [Candidatus Roizmanbacteria bacterium RIFCSPHIGHO2_01_FULL_39_12c]|uniref:Uncharacterized protein n=1 Tax=Candidatus Roizmanbacteria bacterium RIFCSPHIGHO2_01_FULL_39_12c TaxID=1802031 RepID=A0A1F7G9H1_9BACT|nr:MAG: hypothetical protein A2774_02440 [Candidatus Roizmanbacteria bacterium RIFCSPHIGHO2_01_FULL_39_12c]OGK47724.1 MAG: hypothetical protein A2963_00520 [Candidatus Roizmanbacteria bacterium RIFCSPLOWO2_01_FULL_40_13]
MLRKKIVEDQIRALKNREADRLSTLRYILAQIKNKEIDKKSFDATHDKQELTDEEVVAVLRKICKELIESIAAFKKGDRQDLVSEYQKQLVIVNSYLPKL